MPAKPGHSWKTEVAGGIAGGVVTIPSSIGYGVLALASLGDAFVAPAVLAGLYSAVVVTFVVILSGQWTSAAFAPRSIITVLLAAIVMDTIVPAARVESDNVQRTLALVLLVVVTAGAFQALFGVLRLGNVIRYIPSPVMAGFQNAVALLLLTAQLNAMLGLRRPVPVSQLPWQLERAQPLTLAVGIVTVLVIWYAPRFVRRVPAPIAGLVAGTALYHALTQVGLGPLLGPQLGTIPALEPSFALMAAAPSLASDPYLRAHWASFLGSAVSLALIASLDTLLCARTVEGTTGHRAAPSPQLLRVGLGNVAAGVLGAIPSGINLAASFAIHRGGGRTGLATLTCASFVLAAMVLLGPVIALIPRAVIAGVLVVVAIQLADRPTIQRLLALVPGRERRAGAPALDLAVMALVMAVTIALDLVWAVSIGVGVAVVLFLYRMSRSIVRRTYTGDAVRSKRTRDPALTEFLATAGRRIVVMELEGPIFFGTAEKLARHVEATGNDAAYTILDLRRVNELDSTGAAILAQTARRLRGSGGHLLMTHLQDNSAAVAAARDAGLPLTHETSFPDTDAALEWAEDALISAHGLQPADVELAMSEIPVLAGLSEAEADLVATRLRREHYRAGDVVIRQGDADRSLFIMVKGTTTVRVGVAGRNRQVRLASYSRGTVFGEMALLDRQPRSATVTADDDVVCYVLSEDAFGELTAKHPLVAIRLLANLARELSVRLRHATRMISELER
jgi:sulfate permease, SulP family